jgi:acetyl-CoA carboxylase biotin carboxyl carrier protein
MDLKEVLDFIKQVDGLKSFELKEGDFDLRLEWGCGETVYVSAPPETLAAAPAPAASGAATEVIEGSQDEGKDILSPLVGTYHDLEGAKKVSIGSRLKKGDPLCNIEAMKLMNEIVMPEDGEIVWIACSEGDTVEYEQLLFRYK